MSEESEPLILKRDSHEQRERRESLQILYDTPYTEHATVYSSAVKFTGLFLILVSAVLLISSGPTLIQRTFHTSDSPRSVVKPISSTSVNVVQDDIPFNKGVATGTPNQIPTDPSDSSLTTKAVNTIDSTTKPPEDPLVIADPVMEATFEVRAFRKEYGNIKSVEHLPWDTVLEPFQQQYLEVKSFKLANEVIDLKLDNSYEVTWNIEGKQYTGVQASVTPTKVGIHRGEVVVTKKTKDATNTLRGTSDSAVYSHTFTAAVKYVRRELRSLSTADREKYFSAMKTLYTTPGAVGRAKYGSKYKSAEEFLHVHLTGAATSDCDHWHDGAGIITHHVAITLSFEQSLQAIDPSLAAHYWEYGQDKTQYEYWFDSPIFNSDWFGEANPSTLDHRIDDGGIWTELTMPSGEQYTEWDITNSGSLNPYRNAYGIMRSPWNNNPSLYLGRHNDTYKHLGWTMPSCSEFQSCFQQTSLSEINSCVNGYTHGPVHVMIGGAWDGSSLMNAPEFTFLHFMMTTLVFKNLWRMGYTRCPETCETGAICKCAVPDEYIETIGVRKMLNDTNALDAYSYAVEDASDEYLLKFLRAVEDPGKVGDMFTSGASYDPTFWPVHGAAERLLGYKRALISLGTISSDDFDETWGFPAYYKSNPEIYLSGRCDWSNVRGVDDLTLPTCDSSADCYGHQEDDLLEFSNFINKNETYTNREFYTFIHPWSEDVPYTYDTFDYDYCVDDGYDLLDNL